MTSGPDVTIVIGCVADPEGVGRTLDALASQRPAGVEVQAVVVDGTGRVGARADAEVLAAERDASLGALRLTGARAARATFVAFLDASYVPVEGWLASVLDGKARGYRALGGPVALGGAPGAAALAMYLCEYAALMPPVPRGSRAPIAIGNAAFARDVVAADDTWLMRESPVAPGVEPVFVEGMAVEVRRPQGFREYLRDRFRRGRSLALERVGRSSSVVRLAYAVATPLLPPLLLGRACRHTLRRPGVAERLPEALPAMLLALAAGAAGEAVGAIAGARAPGRQP